MSGLKIINSPSSRITTQCNHCMHIMRTPADALYYTAECPACFKDFIVKRYKKPSHQAVEPVQEVRKKAVSSTDLGEEAFVRAVYKNSWSVYTIAVAIIFAFGTFAFGLSGSLLTLFKYLAGIFLITVLQYFVLCVGEIYFKEKEGH